MPGSGLCPAHPGLTAVVLGAVGAVLGVVLVSVGPSAAAPTTTSPTATSPSPTPTGPSPTPTPTTPTPTTSPRPSPSPSPSPPPPVPRRWLIYGRSVQGRPLRVLVVGDPAARRRVVVVGCIHGNECAGLPVLDRLAAAGPPTGVALYLVTAANPDGRSLHRRQNAHRVDLNRNFPGWRRRGGVGDVTWPGPHALSEPESAALATLMLRVRPQVLITYHQAMDVIDDGGGDAVLVRRYAGATGTRYVRLPRYPGSLATWWHTREPSATVVTVELPRTITAARVAAHARAASALARGR